MHPTPPEGLFATGPRSRSRSWAAVTTSVVVHACVVAAALVAARAAASGSLPRVSRPLTFVSVVPAPDPALVVPLEPLHLVLETAPAPVEDTSVPAVEPLRASELPVVAVASVEPRPPIPEPRREPPVPPTPALNVGAFPTTVAVHAFEPPGAVERVGFDAPAARAPDMKPATTNVGAFDQPAAAARPQPGSDRPNLVADAGFGTAMATSRPGVAGRAVADAGFGSTVPAAPRTQVPQVVRPTDFDAHPAQPAPRAPANEPRVDVPLEILSKPTPVYTEEARTLRIEGDVVLDVNFSAAGDVRVVRVVSGLGHGLDESATRAARGMRFKPAQSGGRPIDVRTTVHIVFRLA
jgi:TonB family protein